MLCGWLQREQEDVFAFLGEENLAQETRFQGVPSENSKREQDTPLRSPHPACASLVTLPSLSRSRISAHITATQTCSTDGECGRDIRRQEGMNDGQNNSESDPELVPVDE